MRISSSKYTDYVVEFNEEGLVDTQLLNQVLDTTLPSFATVEEVSETLTAEVEPGSHTYAQWLKLYLKVAARFKKDTILPDTAYWSRAKYMGFESEDGSSTPEWVWTKISTEDIVDIKDFVAMDVETTGLSSADSIIQLSAVKFINGKVVEEFDTFVKPSNDKPISFEITDITGITQEDVDSGKRFTEVVDSFLEFIGDLKWVGHNIVFDIGKFKGEMDRAGLEMPDITTIDTLTVTKQLFPFWPSRGGAYKLENIKHRLDPELISGLQSHNSLDDSKMCGWWLLELQKEVRSRG